MKYLTMGIILLMSFSNSVFCQNNQALIKEAEEKLKTGKTTISQILTDKKYDAVHQETEFRELIKKYCNAETISIVTDTIPGKKIKVIGFVKNAGGTPVGGALIYLYHTDARGWYAADAPHVLMNEGDMRHARLFGYVKTDKDGKFELHTIKPSGYPKSDLPAHIHIHIDAQGYPSVVTELLFDDDKRLIGKIKERAIQEGFIIAKPEKAVTPFARQFSYTILMKQL